MKYKKELEGEVMNIGDHYFTIHFQEDLDRRFERLGQCDLLKGKIWIDADAPERPALSTLLHEIIEAIVCNNTLELKHPQIVVLENALFSFCMNNPHILGVLIKEAHAKTGSDGVMFDDAEPPVEEVMKHIEEVMEDVDKDMELGNAASVDDDMCCGHCGAGSAVCDCGDSDPRE